MQPQADTSLKGYAASMRRHNKALRYLGNVLQWAGALYIVGAHGLILLLPYLLLVIAFTYFLGVPPLVNILRCTEGYKGKKGQLAASLFMQGIWILLMYFLLTQVKIAGMFPFFVIMGIARAFSMPRDQLMQERIQWSNEDKVRQAAEIQHFRSVPDTRMGAPNWNQPWTPPEGFPRARFFRKLKQAHPGLDDLDAAFLIEETIYFFDNLPIKEPKRSETLLQKVESEIDLYCNWSTTRLTDWARDPVGTGMSRSTGRDPSRNDQWLLQRIAEEERSQ